MPRNNKSNVYGPEDFDVEYFDDDGEVPTAAAEEFFSAPSEPSFSQQQPINLPPDMKVTTMYDIKHTSVTETDFDTQAMVEFFRANPVADHVRFDRTYNLTEGPKRAMEFFLAKLTSAVQFQHYERNRAVQGFWNGSPVHIEVSHRDKNDDVTSTNIETFGSHALLKQIDDALEAQFRPDHAIPLKWWYKSDRGVQSRSVFLPPIQTRIVPELYPDITPDPKTYIDNYLKSEASVLLMAGPAGTGKTTLLRHMLKEHDLVAHVIYDEQLMSNDSIFQNFLFESGGDVMIIEDADTVLASRESDQNKLMARFLNISDGLIKLPNKKLIFTTNISDFNKVDPAIIRPGRCYGVLHTRPLDLNEAQAAARACGLSIPVEKQTYTLAELFNRGQGSKVRQMGFAAA